MKSYTKIPTSEKKLSNQIGYLKQLRNLAKDAGLPANRVMETLNSQIKFLSSLKPQNKEQGVSVKNGRMGVPMIQVSLEKAKKIYGDYLSTVKGRKEKYLQELKQIYYHLSKGGQVLDIYETFKQVGVNKDGDPKLGIIRADSKKCVFHKQDLGAGFFDDVVERWGGEMPPSADIHLPAGTFPEWKRETTKLDWQENPEIIRQAIETKVPVVPAHLLPKGKLNNYYILFEVAKWDEVPVAKDPILLKRINSNAFVVLAGWDLTEVEQAVIRGL